MDRKTATLVVIILILISAYILLAMLPLALENQIAGRFVESIEKCIEGETRICGSNIGACEAGVRQCENGIWSARCTGSTGPSQEACDSIDNNCNGEVDEDCPSQPQEDQACADGTGFGSCSSLVPFYCNETTGILEPGCQLCGCAGNQGVCNPNGYCSIFAHIKTVGAFYGSLEDSQVEFAARHFDMFNSFPAAQADFLRKLTSGQIFTQDSYHSITHPPREGDFSMSKYGQMQEYAERNGLAFEDFFLHYSKDVVVDIGDQCNEIVNNNCPVCEADGICNPACKHDGPDAHSGWHGNWNSRPDPDCGPASYPFVRGWNPADDLDGDGVRDVEPPTDPNATAMYRHESRVPYQWFGKYLVNVGNADYRKFNAEYINSLLNKPLKDSVTYDGVVIENSGPGFPEIANSEIVEYPDPYAKNSKFRTDMATVIVYTKLIIGHKMQVPNVANYWVPEYLLGADGQLQEGSLHDSRTTGLFLIFSNISKELAGEGRTEWKTTGTIEGPTDRDRIFSLASYYLSKNDFTYYSFTGSYTDPSGQWFDAMAFDIGQPEAEFQFFASGQDPSGSSGSIPYQVYARRFSNALVLVKFRPWFTSLADDSTATIHDLPGNYHPLNANGTLGGPTNAISLRNADAAILVKEEFFNGQSQ